MISDHKMENPTEDKQIFITDIGGTFCRVKITFGHDKTKTFIKKYKTSTFNSLEEVIDLVVKEADGFKPKSCYASCSIASKIIDNKIASTANYHWPYADGNEIRNKYGNFCGKFQASQLNLT